MRVEVATAGKRRLAVVERRDATPAAAPAVLARRVGDARDGGYLRIKAPLDDLRVVAELDDALESLSNTRGLMLDLREVTGTGLSHETTLAILGRFVTKESTWQVRESAGRARTADKVAPRATPYPGPLVVPRPAAAACGAAR